MIQKKCEQCGAAFAAKRSSRRFCGRDCFGIAHGIAMKKSSEPKCRRVCVICETQFLVKSPSHPGRLCSRPCQDRYTARARTGVKQSPETIAKRARSLKLAWSDPERKSRWVEGVRASNRKWHADPANAKKASEQFSRTMIALHADPKFQKRRDERSRRVMKDLWERDGFREAMTAQGKENYARTIGSEWSINKKNVAAKWIMKHAIDELHADTDYDSAFTEVLIEMRLSHPYDGPKEGSDYQEYLSIIGALVTKDQRLRTISDAFMSEAIPRWAAAWQRRKQLVEA